MNTPETAKQALEMWDQGQPIAAFEVESTGAPQLEIYAAAFELIRVGTREPGGLPVFKGVPKHFGFGLGEREKQTAHSIAYVALINGWARMVRDHLEGEHIKPPAVKNS